MRRTWQPRHVAPEATESAHRSGAILVVEDDPSVREMLALLLEDEGHRTTTAEDGRKALEFAMQGTIRPDLVVADYNLPKGLNGLQVVAELRETLGYEIPAIILTGDISTDTLREIAQGGHLHLNKPVKAKELMDLIRRCLAQPPPAAKASTRQPAPAGGPRLPTVFVVDDDSAVREAMRDLLQQDGRTVELYASSEAFLEAYHPGREGCLLVDARMPGMGGLQLLQRLKSEGTRLPAIMITGQGDVPMAVEAMQAGAADFIEKPVGRGELFASIEHALEQHRGFGQVVGSAGGGSDAPRRSDRAPAPDHGAGAGRSPQQEHCRRPRNQPAHGRESSRRRHEEDRLALAFGADPLGARRRPGRPRRNLSADRQRGAAGREDPRRRSEVAPAWTSARQHFSIFERH